MKEEIVSFGIAKLAKEKGFKLGTNFYYENSLTESIDEEDEKSGPFGWEIGEINLGTGYFINNDDRVDFSNDNWFLCSAPTQSQLQKWLREEHNLHVYTNIHDKDAWIGLIKKIDTNEDVHWTLPPFKTYFFALESALDKALNLI